MLEAFFAALAGGAACAGLLKIDHSRLRRKDRDYIFAVERVLSDAWTKTDSKLSDHVIDAGVLAESVGELQDEVKQLSTFEEQVSSLLSRLESTPTRVEVADAFRAAAELEEQRRREAVQARASREAAEAQAQYELQQAQVQAEQEAALLKQWADQQREQMRLEIEKEIAADLDRQNRAVQANPLNARAQGPLDFQAPQGFDEVNRNRFPRPAFGDANGDFPDPFIGNA